MNNGVEVDDATSTGNSIRANSIYNTAASGIALFNSGNNSQTHPALASGTIGLTTNVQGTFASAANTTFQIDFFGSPSGSQGKTFLGSTSVTTNGSGNASLNINLAPIVPAGNVITATATDPSGNSSSFSDPVPVTVLSTAGDGIPDVWRQTYFGTTASIPGSSSASSDPDHDGLTNLQEFLAGTNPESSSSLLRMTSVTRVGSDIHLTFRSVAGKIYRVEMKSDLTLPYWVVLADQILSSGTSVQITDPGAAGVPKRFYRAVIEP